MRNRVSKAAASKRSGSKAVSEKLVRTVTRTAVADHARTVDTENPSLSSSSSSSAIYFWRESDPNLGYLSQWYYCPFTDDEGKVYATAEHYMMYHKAILFGDDGMAAKILEAQHPGEVRSLGREVAGFDEQTWRENRERIVRQGSYFKFARVLSEDGIQRASGGGDASPPVDTSLRALLLSTGDRELVEASPRDRIWGIGFGAKNAPKNRERWGSNLLGIALMSARATLRKEDQEAEGGRESHGEGRV